MNNDLDGLVNLMSMSVADLPVSPGAYVALLLFVM